MTKDLTLALVLALVVFAVAPFLVMFIRWHFEFITSVFNDSWAELALWASYAGAFGVFAATPIALEHIRDWRQR